MILNKKGSAAVEFGEKLQVLRKDKGLTQEELSSALYVSRTAVSKWESGRGYPGIDSLKQIAKYFCVSLDELLSGEQLLSIAQKEQRQKQSRLCDLVIGLLDVSAILLLLLPLFRESAGGVVGGVALFALSSVSPVLKAVIACWLRSQPCLALRFLRCKIGSGATGCVTKVFFLWD